MYTLSGSLLAVSLVLQILDRGRFVEAQTTQAVCTSAHAWMSNSKGQNPCLVAAYLHLPCGGGQNTNVDAMTQPSQYYSANNDACQCNMISYALFEACQNCQFDNGTTVTSYSRYSLNCTTQNKGYPETIPVGTAVPAWAYQDVSATDFFNLTVALAVAAEGLPDATASIPPGSSTSDIATRSATGTVADSPTTHASSASGSGSASASVSPSAGASSSSSSHSIVGPVVGGVVGGVLGAIALGSLLFYLLRRRSVAAHPGHPEAQTVEVPPASPGIQPTPKSGVYEPWQTAPPAAPLFYNPEDPRTYPSAAPGGPPSSTVTSATLVQPTNYANLTYHGTAEL